MTTTPEDRQKLRRTAVLVGAGAVAVTAAVAIPALAQSRGDAVDASPSTENVVATDTTATTTAPLSAEEQARLRLEHATPEERAAFQLMFLTPEQQAAFSLFTATPEQLAAFQQFVNPPPPPPPVVQAQTANRGSSNTGNSAARTSSGGGSGNGFLGCVKNRESRGQYGAVNGGSGASGAYQFMPSTWNNTARHAGRPDLVGKNPASASASDQDAMAQHLYQWQGSAPWGGGC